MPKLLGVREGGEEWVYYTNFATLDRYNIRFNFFVLRFNLALFFFAQIWSSMSRATLLTFAVPVILSFFLSRSLFPSHTHIHAHTHSYILAFFFPLKSCNLQLLYNMTENTLDHDNTIIIVRFLIFLLPLNFMYVFIFLFFSIHLVFLVREYHKTFMFTYRTSYNDTASPKVL